MPGRALDISRSVTRLVRADLVKLGHYWVVVAGYGAMVVFAAAGAVLIYGAQQATAVTSGSGWQFAISAMFRFLDFGSMILYVMLCLIFAIEVSNSTVKCILTRSVTRSELILSKYVTAMLMVILTIVLFWFVALSTGWYFYGLGSLTENDYLLFSATYLCQQIVIGTLFLLIPFAALAAMALMVSTFSSTMGGAIVIGLLLFFLFQTLSVIPASLGIPIEWNGEEFLIPFGTIGFPAQIFVPLYMLDDVATGIAVDRWWSWEIQKMTAVSVFFFTIFFCTSLVTVQKRDFTL